MRKVAGLRLLEQYSFDTNIIIRRLEVTILDEEDDYVQPIARISVDFPGLATDNPYSDLTSTINSLINLAAKLETLK